MRPRPCHRKCGGDRRPGYQLCDECSTELLGPVATVVYFMLGRLR